MVAAVYARKSTSQADVADEAKSVTRQIEGARAFIASKGWTLDPAHIYTDDGVSGALFASREQFQRMLRDAEAHAFDAIVFYDLDRFGRNARHTMAALNTLADLNIAIYDYSTGQQVDLDSFEGELSTYLKARFAQEEREKARKRTRDAMRTKAAAGYVTGGKLFGYDNVRVAKGHTTRVINDAEARVVVDIYKRFAAGAGLRVIALALNHAGAPSPRAQQGRPNGWSSTSVREVLTRSTYRGEVVYGKTAKKYGRELRDTSRERAQVKQSDAQWLRVDAPTLRIIDADLAARVDARRAVFAERADVAKRSNRAPQNTHGKYLLSGGLLVCPTCHGHFEAFKSPWKPDGVYVCATRRRKPGTCTNTLVLPMQATDDAVLEMIEGEVLGTTFIDELLALVDSNEHDQSAYLTSERARLTREISSLLDVVAAGSVSASIAAPKLRERETQIASIDVQLNTVRERVDLVRLRDALTQRAAAWKAELRAEPTVARVLLRRLVGPLTLWDAADDDVAWETVVSTALLDGLAPIHVLASPPGFEPGFQP
jgi:site-specific DNA recombinase